MFFFKKLKTIPESTFLKYKFELAFGQAYVRQWCSNIYYAAPHIRTTSSSHVISSTSGAHLLVAIYGLEDHIILLVKETLVGI